VPTALVPLDRDPEEARRLGRDAAEALARATGLEPGEIVSRVDDELSAGRLKGRLLEIGGKSWGVAVWERPGPVGLSVGPVLIERPAASPEAYRDFLSRVEGTDGPIAFVSGPLPGIDPASEARVMAELGFARYGRMEMRFPPGQPIGPDPPEPSGAALREVTRSDAAQLVRLHASAYHGRFDRYLFLQDWDEERDSSSLVRDVFAGRWGEFLPSGSWTAEREGRLLAATLASRRRQGVLILEVIVDPASQGQGLGRSVLGASLRSLADAGEKSVYLNVTEGNERALRLYRRLGFVVSLGPTRDWYSTRRIPVPPYDAAGPEAPVPEGSAPEAAGAGALGR
jgi:ribosomal protein S18 acetylase RimI-like enzyme